MEDFAKDLEGMHRHNQRLIKKHGHEEAPTQEMFHYADYMDVEYVKKAEKLHSETF